MLYRKFIIFHIKFKDCESNSNSVIGKEIKNDRQKYIINPTDRDRTDIKYKDIHTKPRQ